MDRIERSRNLSAHSCSQHYVSLLIVPSPFSLSSGIISATFCCFVLCNSSSICSGRMGTPMTEPIKSGRHINRVRNRCFIDTRSSGHSSRHKQGSLPANAAQSCEFRLLLRRDAQITRLRLRRGAGSNNREEGICRNIAALGLAAQGSDDDRRHEEYQRKEDGKKQPGWNRG